MQTKKKKRNQERKKEKKAKEKKKKVMSEVGFEPTPTRVDCDLNAAP